MTLHEKLELGVKAHEAKLAGNEAEYIRISIQEVPLAPHLAKMAKEKFGVDFLLKGGWNLSEAEEQFGSDWLTR